MCKNIDSDGDAKILQKELKKLFQWLATYGLMAKNPRISSRHYTAGNEPTTVDAGQKQQCLSVEFVQRASQRASVSQPDENRNNFNLIAAAYDSHMHK